MKKVLFITLSFIFLFTLFGCKDKNDDTTPPQILFSFEDFYQDFLMYEEHLNAIVLQKESPQETNQIRTQTTDLSSLEEFLVTIEREDILASHYASTFDKVHDAYYEQLITTRDLVQTIKTAISESEDIELNHDFIPETLSNAKFKFVKSSGGYILIDALIGSEHSYLKLSLHDDLLDYQQFSYYYDTNQESLGEDFHLNYNYFKFLENKDAVYIFHNETSSYLSYINIELDEEFSIGVGSEFIESGDSGTKGYTISRFDRQTNSQAYLDIVNDKIVSETYDIFDEYGGVYRYDDHDITDGKIQLQINFVTATGWDYVVASDASNEEIDAATGVFLNDGTKIYDEWFNYTYTPTYGFLGLWIDLSSKEDLTDELFSLNQFQMNLDHPKANLDFFNQVDLDHFYEIKEEFQIENLNMFAEDLDQELYEYIDEDIRLALEGKNNPDVPSVPLGDVEPYLERMALFQQHFETAPEYVAEGSTFLRLKDGDGLVVSTTTVTESSIFSLNDLYFRLVQHSSGKEYSYDIDGTKGKIVIFEAEGPTLKYRVASDQATQENFMAAYNDVFGEEEKNVINRIKQINDTTFELYLFADHFKVSGVSLVTLYEQMGISGLSGQELMIKIEFAEDFKSYDQTMIISDLSVSVDGQSYTIETKIEYSISIKKPLRYISPLDQFYYDFYLPKNINDVLIVKGLHNDRYVLDKGTQYLHLWLTPGEYSVDVYEDYLDTSVTIFDDKGNELVNEDRFTVTTEGLIIVEITSSVKQSTDIYVRANPSPKFVDFYFDDVDGTLIESVDPDGYTFYYIHISSASQDRILILDPYFLDDVLEFESMSIEYNLEAYNIFEYCDIYPKREDQKTCYFYLPKDVDIVMELDASYSGEFGISYVYLDIPSETVFESYIWSDLETTPMILLTSDQQETLVSFTITEAGYYELSMSYEYFAHSYQDATLYDQSGNVLSEDWDHQVYFDVGEYTINIHITNEFGEVNVLCIAKMIFHD
ncbi:MAG: hypothetical protein A2Y45_08770 [Tenericutes bacterium GWC2_34_14]|nr:MAG: hypothetical protein A2Y45_08770 [Tenericutes bacterium GWC2_34_14]OHE34964.1 MAG: hypothetical protein A2012_02380 [Tenericutes bacterium GWE2_34_108]OHE37176.1 MAG: hypothetical protein A2Y46_00630 [Tenericutes bacterium GWF1_35_14]OHE39692.1 MAG: hypothetical protein A2Y44_02230 [Tenericutes bacterium GWF2_35_184]OHE44120.1 MAG: hypothetical protein A2221_03280 [Tenericutes bacterium RIFOXYA2_FULL_36_32]OHE45465.1 MAG: hypothetical protein A3K26_00885 [Tenericutes bacterium RIFOXYA1